MTFATFPPDICSINFIVMIRHIQIQIEGQLTHLGFKLQTMIAARNMQINGTVAEMPGKMVIEAEGEEKNLNGLLTWCKNGPLSEKPGNITVYDKPLAYYDEFTIL